MVTPLTDRTIWISLCPTTQTTLIAFLRHPGSPDNSILFLGPTRLKIRLFFFWERIEAPLPPLRPWPKCNFSHPRQLSPFPERLELPFSNDEILTGYEEIVSSGTDHFTAWVMMSHHDVLVQHMVDIHKATAKFREASERKPATSSHTKSANKHFAIRSVVQKILSIYNCNRGPRRGKEDAFEKQIAGWWHESLPRDTITQVARFSPTRTPSTPTSLSSPSTFMTLHETCPIKSWKESRDGSCKVFFHVPHFVDHQ